MSVKSSSSTSVLSSKETVGTGAQSTEHSHSSQVGENGFTRTETSSLFAIRRTSYGLDVIGPDMSDVKEALHSKREFICGSGAAFINITITFPINKVIFRQQLHGVSSLRALRQLQKDGLRLLYRGLLPPLLLKTTSMSIMFGSYTKCQGFIQDLAPRLTNIQNHIVAALIAGALEATLAPFERVQTLMQNRQFHDKFSNTLDAFKTLRKFGVAEYYRGLTVIVLRNGPSNVCFFLGREYLAKHGPMPSNRSEKVMKDFICGACLGAVISSFFFPFNVVKTHMQSRLGGPFKGVLPTFKLVLSERGGSFRKLFKGVHLNYTRSFISWGIINASYEFLLSTFFKSKS